jgi:putative aldouronate transport system permease protein
MLSVVHLSRRRKWYAAVLRDKYLLLLALPGVLYFVVFHYVPMYGVSIAFKDFKASQGILGSAWAGVKWFRQFFESVYFTRVLRNTLLINIYTLLWGFPIPVILALALNEFRDGPFKKAVQTVSYLPHFVSVVVVVGILRLFLQTDGLVERMLEQSGLPATNYLSEPSWFRSLFVGTGIWQGCGWGSIIYLAALSGVNPELCEAAEMDGASRWQKVIHINLPSIQPTIVTMLILNIGRLLSLGHEKILLMYSPAVYETADVISTYVYRRGIEDAKFSFGTAVGLFNATLNIALLIAANAVSRRVNETSLW